jgi:hypothetical protein
LAVPNARYQRRGQFAGGLSEGFADALEDWLSMDTIPL